MEHRPQKNFMLMFNILTSVFSAAAVLLNGFLIIVITKNKSLQLLENTFLVNLAAGDILMGVCGFSCTVIWNLSNQPVAACISLVCVCSYATGITLLFFSVMTLEKYVRILYPFHYIRLCTKRNVLLITVFVHIASIGLIGMCILLFQGNNATLCSVYTEFRNIDQLFIASLISTVIVIVAVANTKILYVSWKKRNDVQDFNEAIPARNRIRGVKVLAVLVMFMFVLYIPSWTVIMLKVLYELPQDTLDKFELCAALLWFLTPVADGVAFLFCRQDIRKCAWKLIRSQ